MTTRRLINAHEVARILGFSKAWFDKHRARLERDHGFPAPVLDADEFGGRRWDSRAIDAWMDSRMDPHLRQADRRQAVNDAATDWRGELSKRAKEMSL
jgi:predicted DNA-binding transcriptional regulator AlpA